MTQKHTNPLVSIVITTRNRHDDLLHALASCMQQGYGRLEILVVDDASDTPVADSVREAFPDVRVLRNETALGVVPARTIGYEKAAGEIIIGLDDDAEFQDPATVDAVVQAMRTDDQLGAVAISFIEPKRDTPPPPKHYPSHGDQLRSFTGCAHAVRKAVFMQIGGYRRFFIRQGEERDLCIRLLQAGYRVGLVSNVKPVIHWVSPVRDRAAINFYGIRNTILYDWFNIPQPYTFPRIAYDAAMLLKHKWTLRQMPTRLFWLLWSGFSCLRYWRLRRPVSRSVYATFRSLPPPPPGAYADVPQRPPATGATLPASSS